MPDFVVKRFGGLLHYAVEMDADVTRIRKEERALEVARIAITVDLAQQSLNWLIAGYTANGDKGVRALDVPRLQ